MISEKTLIHLNKKLDVTDLSGEKVMIDFDTGKYFLLKGSANEIWNYITTDITVEQIVEKLLTQYNIDAKTCLNSTIRFLEDLEKNNIITCK